MIGSFNMDNRSSFYNTEAAIFCEGNKKLTAALEKDMKIRIGSSLELKDRKMAIDKDGKEVSVYGNANFYKILMLKIWTPASKLMRPLL
jgi:phosphatidylserine/phosphatidylglycerophosphate/cardiolipin synthase-like enzyme